MFCDTEGENFQHGSVSLYFRRQRSPNMRHVSRTHRVDLDWLFDRINLEAAVQIKYANTAQQIADVLTKSSFSQERSTQFLHFFGLMLQQTHSCSHLWYSRLFATACPSDQETFLLNKYRQNQSRYMVHGQNGWSESDEQKKFAMKVAQVGQREETRCDQLHRKQQ